MSASVFCNKIKNRPSRNLRYLWHFTDKRNIPTIKEKGLLSLRTIKKNKLCVVHGGNSWSHQADERVGLDAYVHLSFFDQHRMEYIARTEGRIGESVFLRISPDVVKKPGSKFCPGIANKVGVPSYDIAALKYDEADFEMLFSFVPWGLNRSRLEETKKYQLLIPDQIEPEYILF